MCPLTVPKESFLWCGRVSGDGQEKMVGTRKGRLQAWALQHGAWEAGMVQSRDQGPASRQREVGEIPGYEGTS